MDTLIRCEELWKIYRLGDVQVQALRGLSLSIARGEFVSLMGASGSGKSTFMNLLGCLDVPTKGLYRLDGRDVASASPDELADIRNRHIGFVFQSFNLMPRTSALENVQLPLFYRGLSLRDQRARAAAALERVGLSGREQHFPSQLSGGQQQRVAIARALVADPSILLADEPTGNLDTHAADEIFALMRRFNRERRTAFLIVTHDPRLARRCDRIIELVDGRIASDCVNDAIATSDE